MTMSSHPDKLWSLCQVSQSFQLECVVQQIRLLEFSIETYKICPSSSAYPRNPSGSCASKSGPKTYIHIIPLFPTHSRTLPNLSICLIHCPATQHHLLFPSVSSSNPPLASRIDSQTLLMTPILPLAIHFTPRTVTTAGVIFVIVKGGIGSRLGGRGGGGGGGGEPGGRGGERFRKALRMGRQAHIIATSTSTVLF